MKTGQHIKRTHTVSTESIRTRPSRIWGNEHAHGIWMGVEGRNGKVGEGLLVVPLNSLKGPAVKPVTGQREGRTEREGESLEHNKDGKA